MMASIEAMAGQVMASAWLTDVARVTLWLFLLTALFIPLEHWFGERHQPVRRAEFWVDLGYFYGNGVLTAAVLAAISAWLAVAARGLVPAVVTDAAAALPLAPRLAAILVVGEFGSYWGHRWTHRVPFLWRFHAIHHSGTQVDWLTNTRAHPLDMMFTRICGLVPVYLLGLAGAGAADMTAAAVIVLTTVWGYFIHANLRCRFGWLESVIATPAFHRWHHANDARRDRNYASTLPVYDRLFGTFHLPPDAMPPSYGIDTPMPHGLVGQLLRPFARSRL